MALKILSRPKGNAEEYGRWSVNPYLGCPHGCLYCYLKKGVWAKALGGNEVKLKNGLVSDDHAYHLAMAEIIEHREEIVRDGGLFMSFVTDPCADETRDLFYRITSSSMQRDIPVTILTKSRNRINKYYEQMRSLRQFKNNIAFGWTLTGHNELEPYAPTNEARLLDMRIVNKHGFKVWASIEPVIDFDSSLYMIKQALKAGCRHFKIGLLTNNTKVCRAKYDVQECLAFIHDVMWATESAATVYWKQSVREFLGQEDFARATVGYSHSVDKDYNMFREEE